MNELINKISSYNIFNYLFPGAIFSILTADVIHYPVVQQDVIARLFLYYFVGLVISRWGSLIIEPILKWHVKFAPYSEYITAEAKDKKIEVLSEANNSYRTLCAMFSLLFVIRLYAKIQSGPLCSLQGWEGPIGSVLLMVMFFLAYRKQTGYIIGRINKANTSAS